MTDEQELVEMMAKAFHDVDCVLTTTAMDAVLSVVKANIGKVAKVCDECKGSKIKEFNYALDRRVHQPCEFCHGTGVVSK